MNLDSLSKLGHHMPREKVGLRVRRNTEEKQLKF